MLNTLQRHSHFSPQRLLLGLLFSTIISTLAYRRRSLSRSGIAGSIITGTITFGLGGWEWGLSLIFFFISSSLLSHFRAPVKAQTAADKFSKGNQRDIGQVAANGGIATLLALGYGLASSRPLQDLFQAGYTGALATAPAVSLLLAPVPLLWAHWLWVLSSGYCKRAVRSPRRLPESHLAIFPCSV